MRIAEVRNWNEIRIGLRVKRISMALVTNKKIGVLMGGLSSEREVSLASGNAILTALREKGYHPVAIDVGRDAAEKIHEHGVEIAFIALHGRFGEDGAIQGMLEVMGIPYTGFGHSRERSRHEQDRFEAGVPVPGAPGRPLRGRL